MRHSIVYYICIGLLIGVSNGNMDSKYSFEHKAKSVIYWPMYMMNYFNAVSNINQVNQNEIQRSYESRNR